MSNGKHARKRRNRPRRRNKRGAPGTQRGDRSSTSTSTSPGSVDASTPVPSSAPTLPSSLAPTTMTPVDVEALQQTSGNRAVSQLLTAERPTPNKLTPDPERDRMLTEHLQGTGRAPGLGPGSGPSTKLPGKLREDVTSPEVKQTIEERASLKGKATELKTGAPSGSLRETLGGHGVYEGLKAFFGAEPTADTHDPTGMMQAVRLSVALGRSDEAKEFLEVARDHKNEVKRLMSNRPEDFEGLLVKAEFAAMTQLIRQELAAPSSALVGGPSGAHQFDEHGAHNSAAQMILQSIASGNPKTSWVSASVEQQAVQWAQDKVDAEVAQLAAGVTTGPDSINWKGDIAGAGQVIADNRGYPNVLDHWVGPRGVRPLDWATFVNDSETFRTTTQFRWFRRNGRRGGNLRVGPVFNSRIDVLTASGADAGIVGTLAGRKVKATAVNVPEPVRPMQYPLLTDPSTTFVQGGTYYHLNGAQWQQITLVQYDAGPPMTNFKAVFRKTNDPALAYKVYTAYPV